MSQKTQKSQKATESGRGRLRRLDDAPVARSMYINAPEAVLTEIENLLAADPLSRGRFLGKLLELGLAAYKAEKRG